MKLFSKQFLVLDLNCIKLLGPVNTIVFSYLIFKYNPFVHTNQISVRQIAEDLNLNFRTIKKALDKSKSLGLLEFKKVQGGFVYKINLGNYIRMVANAPKHCRNCKNATGNCKNTIATNVKS